MSDEARDALAFLKSKLLTVESLAVNAKDQEDYEMSRGGIVSKNPRTLIYFTLSALMTMVIELDARLSPLETDGK
jgi:hypothetical protein